MIFTAPARPVSRLRVLLGALALVCVLAGIIAVSEMLRHPHPDVTADVPDDDADIRDEIVCPPDEPPEESPRRQPTDALAVSSGDLYDCPAFYDGRLVRYEGEVVGAVMHRGREGAWTQLNDDVYAGDLGPLPTHRNYRGANAGVGVFLPADLARQVQTVAAPRVRGDRLVVVGTFHRIDPHTRDAAIIRADTGTVEQTGGRIDDEPLRDRQVVGVVLALAAVGLTTAHRVASRREPLREVSGSP